MKRLVLASLVAPGVASAGFVIVDAKPVPVAQTAQQTKGVAIAALSAQSATVQGREPGSRSLEAVKASDQEAAAPGKLIQKIETKPVPTWTLTAGRTVGKELQAWGEKAGWKVIWNLPKDWAIPASTTYQGEFKAAASSVIKNLAANGAIIRAQFFDGNNTLVVNGPGAASQ